MAKNNGGNGGGNATLLSAKEQDEIRRAKKATQKKGHGGKSTAPTDTFLAGLQDDRRRQDAERRHAGMCNRACGHVIAELRKQGWDSNTVLSAKYFLEVILGLRSVGSIEDALPDDVRERVLALVYIECAITDLDIEVDVDEAVWATAGVSAQAYLLDKAHDSAVEHTTRWARQMVTRGKRQGQRWSEATITSAIATLDVLFGRATELPEGVLPMSGQVLVMVKERFAAACLATPGFLDVVDDLPAFDADWWDCAVAGATLLLTNKRTERRHSTHTGKQDDTVRLVVAEPKTSDTEVTEPELAAVA